MIISKRKDARARYIPKKAGQKISWQTCFSRRSRGSGSVVVKLLVVAYVLILSFALFALILELVLVLVVLNNETWEGGTVFDSVAVETR